MIVIADTFAQILEMLEAGGRARLEPWKSLGTAPRTPLASGCFRGCLLWTDHPMGTFQRKETRGCSSFVGARSTEEGGFETSSK